MLAISRKYALTCLGRRYLKDLAFVHKNDCSNVNLSEYGLRAFESWYQKTPKEARSCFIKGVPLQTRWNMKVYDEVLKASMNLIAFCLFLFLTLDLYQFFQISLRWAGWAVKPGYKPLRATFWEELRRDCILILSQTDSQ